MTVMVVINNVQYQFAHVKCHLSHIHVSVTSQGP
jgi:hypothetical protein